MSSQGGGSELQAGMILYTLTGQLVSTRLGPLVLSELPLFFMVIWEDAFFSLHIFINVYVFCAFYNL